MSLALPSASLSLSLPPSPPSSSWSGSVLTLLGIIIGARLESGHRPDLTVACWSSHDGLQHEHSDSDPTQSQLAHQQKRKTIALCTKGQTVRTPTSRYAEDQRNPPTIHLDHFCCAMLRRFFFSSSSSSSYSHSHSHSLSPLELSSTTSPSSSSSSQGWRPSWGDWRWKHILASHCNPDHRPTNNLEQFSICLVGWKGAGQGEGAGAGSRTRPRPTPLGDKVFRMRRCTTVGVLRAAEPVLVMHEDTHSPSGSRPERKKVHGCRRPGGRGGDRAGFASSMCQSGTPPPSEPGRRGPYMAWPPISIDRACAINWFRTARPHAPNSSRSDGLRSVSFLPWLKLEPLLPIESMLAYFPGVPLLVYDFCRSVIWWLYLFTTRRSKVRDRVDHRPLKGLRHMSLRVTMDSEWSRLELSEMLKTFIFFIISFSAWRWTNLALLALSLT